jgi:hypothetical protein
VIILLILYISLISIWGYIGINLISDIKEAASHDDLTSNYRDFFQMSFMLYILSTMDFFPDMFYYLFNLFLECSPKRSYLNYTFATTYHSCYFFFSFCFRSLKHSYMKILKSIELNSNLQIVSSNFSLINSQTKEINFYLFLLLGWWAEWGNIIP